MTTRVLTHNEQQLANDVFGYQLPAWKKIWISDSIGFGNRPWTQAIPGSWWNPTAGIKAWCMHLGKSGYNTTVGMRDTLVHELTHVWQGYHSFFGDSYMLKSVVSQTVGAGYDYKPGKPWDDYNVEQKAEIVEDWYEDGMRKDSPLFTYIENHIQAGKD